MKNRTFTKEHRENISKACKGRKTWSKGKLMSKRAVYKNMASHLRFDVEWEWLAQFPDIEKLKLLNDCITNRSGRYSVSTDWYKDYISRFYHDKKFNNIYFKWIESGKERYLKPSIDHLTSRCKGGGNETGNIQFLTWFENRCKNDMTVTEWKHIKDNIKDYFYE